jgi:hypothetical protein
MYADSSVVRDARQHYFDANGFSEAANAADWVKVKLGPIPIVFPNTSSRKRAIKVHDLHHIATEYSTSLLGEAEIASFEIAGGMTDHWAGWLLNAGAVSYGVVFAPRRVYRAFMRGRNSRNLYHAPWDDSLLELSVGELRQKIGIDREAAPPSWRDRAAFFAWTMLVGLPTLIALGVALVLWAT